MLDVAALSKKLASATGPGNRLLAALGVLIGVGLGTPAAAQLELTIDTLDDIAGADVDGQRSFRWAIGEVNSSSEETNLILFDPSLIAEADTGNVIQIVLGSAPPTIVNRLEIRGPTNDATATEYFVDIFRDPTEGEEFIVLETLTLTNAQLRSNAIVFAGGANSEPTGTIDLVYDIGNFVHDIFWFVLDNSTQRPQVEPGRLVKLGAGELALLPTTADYSGGTLLVDGVLRTDTRSLQGDIQLCANLLDDGFESDNCSSALLIFEMPSTTIDPDALRSDPPTEGTYAGDITSEDDARVVKIGTGQLTLTGTNSYPGGTYIMQGTVAGDTDSIQGDVHVCSDETITKPNGGDPIACGSVETTILRFDLEEDGPFSGTLHGQGIVQKDGDATLTFDETQDTFGGTVEVREGRLVIDDVIGTIGSSEDEVDVVVRDGALLSGMGTIQGDVEVDVGGEIEGSLDLIGDLDVSGSLNLTNVDMTGETARFRNGSRINLDPEIIGGPGRLTLDSTLTLRGGAVDVTFESDDVFTFPTGFFTIAESAVPIDGTLTGGERGDGILFDNAIFDLDLTYNDSVNCGGGLANNVCLGIAFAPVLEDDAETANQRAIALALDQAYLCAQDPNAPGCGIEQGIADDFNDLYDNFAVPSSALPQILDQLSGDEYAAYADIRAAAAARFNRSISRRFDLELSDPAGASEVEEKQMTLPSVSLAGSPWLALGGGARNYRDRRSERMPWRKRKPKDPMPMDRHAGEGGLTAWLDIHGVMGELEGGKDNDDIDYRIYGPLLGLDYGITENITLGVAAGYVRTELDTPGPHAKGTSDGYQTGLYAAALFDDFYVMGATRYAYTDITSRRRIRFGDVDRTATGDFHASDLSAFFEAAYAIAFPEAFNIPDNVIVQPLVSASYNRLAQSSFDESDAGSLNLRIKRQELDTVQTTLGVRLAMFGRDTEERYLLPQLRVAYEREWLDLGRPLDAELRSAGNNGKFEIDGIELPADRAVVGVSSEVGLSDRVNAFVDYDLRAAPDLLEHSLAFGIRAIW